MDYVRIKGRGKFIYEVILICREGDYVRAWLELKKRLEALEDRHVDIALKICKGELRTLDEFIYRVKTDPFKRALAALSSWLRRRGYRELHEFDPHYHVNQRYIGSTEAYDRFIRIVYYVNGWVDRTEEQ